MRTELAYMKPDPDNDEISIICPKAEATMTYVVFTDTHPTEMADVLDENGEPTGKQTPQEYGIGMIVTDVLDGVEDLPVYMGEWGQRSLEQAGCPQ